MKNLTVFVKENIAKKILSKLNSLRDKLSIESKIIFTEELIRHQTYTALETGILGSHFGFIEETRHERISSLIQAITSQLNVKFEKQTGIGNVLFILYLEIHINYDTIVNLKQSIVLNRQDDGSLQRLPWLEWLLMRGAGPIILKHHINFGDYPGNQSRSKRAIMLENRTWGVPTEYSGTEDDNWITYSMDKTIDRLANRTIALLSEII